MAGPGRYSIEAFADTITELCRELGLPPAVFLSHSLGGPLAVRFATRHPGLTKAIVLVADTGDVFAEALGGRHLGRNLRHHPMTVASASDPAPSPGRTQPQQDRPGQTRRIPGNDSTP